LFLAKHGAAKVITVDKKWKRIGISLSGGADSALLAYLILNQTDALIEQGPTAMNSFADIMNEGMDEIRMTSRDAASFGAMRQNMKEAMGLAPSAPKVMEDPETGKVFEVPVEVQQAMTRDYSSLIKAMNKKKG
jgi:NH3-dependent NAD+ synthetase